MGNPLSEQIARIIEQMIEENGGELELQRNKLAGSVGCVPSQINYVLSSRFTPESGFLVESRRGGGGCIKITRLSYSKDSLLAEVIAETGSSIDEATARGYLVNLIYHGIVSERDAALIISAVNDSVLRGLPLQYRNAARAAIFKAMLIESSK